MIWFKCYIAWDEIVEELSDAEAGRFFKALMKYHKSGEIRSLSGTEKLMYNVALKQAKQDAECRTFPALPSATQSIQEMI